MKKKDEWVKISISIQDENGIKKTFVKKIFEPSNVDLLDENFDIAFALRDALIGALGGYTAQVLLLTLGSLQHEECNYDELDAFDDAFLDAIDIRHRQIMKPYEDK